jgi:hypothetical protein
MRCARCEFENIPGQTRCIRCGSILEAGAEVIEIHPPRMPAWRKPFRDATRWLRELRIVPEKPPGAIGRGFEKIASGNMAGLVLSIVPGLAHLLNGRFREVRLFVLAWFISLSAGVFLYGGGIGTLLIGLAIGIHAWITVRYSLFEVITTLLERFATVLLILAALGGLYWGIPHIIARGPIGGHASLNIQAMNIHQGDYLLVRHLADVDTPLPRGTLVLIHPEGLRNTRRDESINPGSLMIGQIAALPGETIHVEDNAYVVNGRRLDSNRFPVPRWLRGNPPRAGIYVPARAYFVSVEYTVGGHGHAAVTDSMIAAIGIVKASGIRGRAFMQWWPLSRRRFITIE